MNPAPPIVTASDAPMCTSDIASIIEAVQAAQRDWAQTTFDQRQAAMHRAAGLLRDHQDDYARLITDEMHKPISQARAEIDKCAWLCDYYAKHVAEFLAPEPIETEYRRSFVNFAPLGVVFAVMPWNFPFWQVFRFAVPTLMAGNAALLKHASNVPGCALAIEALFRQAGFPSHLFRTLFIEKAQTEDIIANAHVRAVTLTGSVSAGEAVAALAGRYSKKTVLELGGSDPYLVLRDADLQQAAACCVKSRMINNGQSCIAAKRFVAEKSIF